MKYFVDAITKHYADFQGRARRKEYWMFVFFFALTDFVIISISTTLGQLYYLAVLLPTIAVAVRRMHDVGRSGWFMLIPIYNLILFCSDGTPDANQYGPNPKSFGAAAANAATPDDAPVDDTSETKMPLATTNFFQNDFFQNEVMYELGRAALGGIEQKVPILGTAIRAFVNRRQVNMPNRREVNMSKCRFCNSSLYGLCSASPSKKHEHLENEKKCEFCGSSSYGHCSTSPFGKHRHGHGANTCIWCGSSSYGHCSTSPSKVHEK